ncbi:MAG: hypothetical protein IJ576_01315 [Synergistaceae bacterium]|nr:hypothetical protein [Synergistaceae bacterium]MBR1603909.1 hypothetical protein [Synergistaceae bacterium]
MSSKGSKKGFDDILTSTPALWFIAILSSIIMWMYVTGRDESSYITRRFSCQLEYRSLDPQAMLRNRVSEVDIEIRGPEESIMHLNYDNIVCWIDARNLVPGKRYTQNVNVAVPQDIDLVSCVPSQIVLDLVRQVVRLMPVEITLPQNMPDGQYLEGVEIIPKEVGIRGSESDVAKVGALRAAPTFEELSSGKELLLPVKFVQSEPFNDSVTLEPNQIRFKGSLVRGLPKKRVPVTVRITGQPDIDHEVKSVLTDPAEVQIEGERAALAKVETVEAETVNISLFAKDNTLVVPLKEPDVPGVALTGTQTVRITVQLGDAAARKTLTNIPVEIINSENLSKVNDLINKNPEFVSVNVEGLPSVIENLTRENSGIRAYVDLANIFITPVTLPVTAEINNASADLKIVRVDPAAVTISVNEPDSSIGSMSEPEALSLNDAENLDGLGSKSIIRAINSN